MVSFSIWGETKCPAMVLLKFQKKEHLWRSSVFAVLNLPENWQGCAWQSFSHFSMNALYRYVTCTLVKIRSSSQYKLKFRNRLALFHGSNQSSGGILVKIIYYTNHKSKSCNIEESSCLIQQQIASGGNLVTATTSSISASPRNQAGDSFMSAHDTDFMHILLASFFFNG